MLGNRSRPRIPLPKQWPSRVRSGVLHAISLAHYSLTFLVPNEKAEQVVKVIAEE